MLKKPHRLRNDKDINDVLKGKKGVFDAVCGVKYSKNKLDVSRITVIVGTKVSKKAVDRNWVKRQYREISKKLLPRIQAGYDIALLAGKGALDLDYAAKEERLEGTLRKSGLLKG
jgi:ribonuclease P protein component